MSKIGPNELCPCGSGRKFKKCCGDPRAAERYTRDERAQAFQRLVDYVDVLAVDDEARASAAFWGRYAGRAEELPAERAELFDPIEQLWFLCDHRPASGATIVERVLAGAQLSPGEHSFLTALARSSMRIYEVVATVPGASLTLRDAIEGGAVTANDRQASRALGPGAYLAARIVPRGPSGGPEIEAGLLHLGAEVREPLLARIRTERAQFLARHPGGDVAAFYKHLPPLFHEVWIATMLG